MICLLLSLLKTSRYKQARPKRITKETRRFKLLFYSTMGLNMYLICLSIWKIRAIGSPKSNFNNFYHRELGKFGTELKTSSLLRNLTLRKSKNKKSSSRLKVRTRIIHQKKAKTRIIHKRGMIVREIRRWLMRTNKKRRVMRRVSRKWEANLCLQHTNLWTFFSKNSSKRLSRLKVKAMKLLSERGWLIK